MRKKKSRNKEESIEKIITYSIVGVIIFGVFALFFTIKTMFFTENPTNQGATQAATMQVPAMSGMSLTGYDKGLARKFMDKNNDGKCDVCGMDVQLCIDSGQMQCNMDSKSTIGILGSQHVHADWKIYTNGKVLDEATWEPLTMDMSNPDKPVTSSFIHLDKGAPAPEKAGDIIHMHATGVPLWIFFKSVGMDFGKDCLALRTGEKFCNDGKNALKFYVNGKPNSEWENYVFKDLDKILISYGDEIDLTQQLNSITSFSKDH